MSGNRNHKLKTTLYILFQYITPTLHVLFQYNHYPTVYTKDVRNASETNTCSLETNQWNPLMI